MAELKKIFVETQTGRYDIAAEAVWIGPDLLVYIYGGEAPHIGAVAAAQPRTSLKDPNRPSATASVLTYVGHKEDVLAKMASEALASALKARVVATAGVHWDNLDDSGIAAVMQNSREIVAALARRLKEEGK